MRALCHQGPMILAPLLGAPAGCERAIAFQGATRRDAERFERDSLAARIDHKLFWMQTAAQPFNNPAYYTDSLDPATHLTHEYASGCFARRRSRIPEMPGSRPSGALMIRCISTTPWTNS